MSRRLLLSTATVAVVAIVATAIYFFVSSAESDTVTIGEPLPTADIAATDVPAVFADADFYTTPWEAAPKGADGVLLGLGQHDDRLRFTAVRADGTELWHADRPLACAGFTITTAGDRPIAVLNDLVANDDGTLSPTASALDLHTGETVWGPVDVPGPNYGPGLVYAGAPDEYFGEAGPLTALDPATGKTVFAESDDTPLRIVGQFDGNLILTDENTLTGQDASGEHLWSYDADALPWSPDAAISVPGIDPGGRWAVIGTGQHDDGVLLDTVTGTVHAHNVSVAIGGDNTETVAYLNHETLGVAADDGLKWQQPAHGRLLSAIGAFGLAAQHGAGLEILSLDDGAPVHSDNTSALTPSSSTAGGDHTATVLATDDEQFFLAVSPAQP